MSIPDPEFQHDEYVIHRDRTREGIYIVHNAVYHTVEKAWSYCISSIRGGGRFWVEEKNLIRRLTPEQEQRERDLRWFLKGWRASNYGTSNKEIELRHALFQHFSISFTDGVLRWPDRTQVELP